MALIQATDLHYQGAFRVPASLAYGGGALTFDPQSQSLFMVGHSSYQNLVELSIPAVRTGPVAGLEMARILQPLSDPLEGKRMSIDGGPTAGGAVIGGIYPIGDGNIALTVYSYYDGAANQTLSHFSRPRDLSIQGKVKGPYATTAPKAGYVAGAFAVVPKRWRAELGSAVVSGLCSVPIISRTSSGPSIWGYKGNTGVPIEMFPLCYYPLNHPLGQYGTQNPYYNGTGGPHGLVFPVNFDSFLSIGTIGVGPYCYGEGGATEPPGAIHWCFDPESTDKGNHGYPYKVRVWALAAADLARVHKGELQPWDVKPYAYWDLDLPYVGWRTEVTGVTYDPATGRIFIGQGRVDNGAPVVHVFNV